MDAPLKTRFTFLSLACIVGFSVWGVTENRSSASSPPLRDITPCDSTCGDDFCDRPAGDEDRCPSDCVPGPSEPYSDRLALLFEQQAGQAREAVKDSEILRERVSLVMGLGRWPEERGLSPIPVTGAAPEFRGDAWEAVWTLHDPLSGALNVRILWPDPFPQEEAPVIVALHGHGTVSASLRDEYGALELARGGAIVLLPDFPSLKDDLFSELGPQEDLLQAGRSLMGLRLLQVMTVLDLGRTLPGASPHRAGIYGHSAGAILSIFAAAFDSRFQAVVTDWDPAAVKTRDNLLVSTGSADNYLPSLASLGEWRDLVDSVDSRLPVLVQDYDFPAGPSALVSFLTDSLWVDARDGDGLCTAGEDGVGAPWDCLEAGEEEAKFVHGAPSLGVGDGEVDEVVAGILKEEVETAVHRNHPLREAIPRILQGSFAGKVRGGRFFSSLHCLAPLPEWGASETQLLVAEEPSRMPVRARFSPSPSPSPSPLVILLAPPPGRPDDQGEWRQDARSSPWPSLVKELTRKGFSVLEPLLVGSVPTDPRTQPYLALRLTLVGTSLPALWISQLSSWVEALHRPGEEGEVTVVAWGGFAGVAQAWALQEPRVKALWVDSSFDPSLSQPGWLPALRMPGAAPAGGKEKWLESLNISILEFPARSDGSPRDGKRLAEEMVKAPARKRPVQ